MWWILLLVMVGYVGIIAAFLAFSFGALPEQSSAVEAPSLDDPTTVLAVYGLGLPIGYVVPRGSPWFPVVLAVTAEHRYQTITSTFLAEPRRWVVLTAKLVVALVVGLPFGVLALLGLNAWSATRDVAQFLPGAAADAMAGASLYALGGPVPLLHWWQGGWYWPAVQRRCACWEAGRRCTATWVDLRRGAPM